jgi:polyisoprenoid-binding protein YceI
VESLLAVAFCAVVGGATLPTTVGTESLVIDPAASRVRIHLGRAGLFKFLGHDHEIDAPLAAGRIEIKDGDPARSSVRLRFEARRLAVVPGTEPADDIPKVEQRMRGPEVLDVARYPEIAFQSSSVAGEAPGKDRYRLRVRGALQVKGRPFPVEIPLEVHRAGDTLEATGEVELRLRELGIAPPSVAGVVNVANDFRVTFEVRARREDPFPPNGGATP